MNKYEDYKKVEIPWVRKIPTHWRIERNKNIFIKTKSVVGIQNKTTDLLSLTTKGIKVKSKDQIGGKQPSSYERYQLVNKENLVLCLFDLDCSAVFSDVSKYNGMISPAYDVFKVEKQIPQYYKYLFSYLFQDRVYKIYSKSVRYTITEENFNTLLTLVPPLEEQQQIAKYLDWKIKMIDEIIHIEKQKIEKLETLKQKYLDNIFDSLNCRKYIRLAKLGNFSKGGGFSRENLTNSINEAILYGDIYTKYNYWLEKCVSTIDDKGFKDAKYIQEPAVLFTASGETKEDIGKAVAFIGNHKIAVGGDVIIFKVKKDINVKYISYFCNTSKIKYEKYIESSGEIIVHISSEALKNIKIPFITIEEQEDIVSKIDSFIELQNKIISSKNIIIENYMKLKQSLISEVVTGQIDVRYVKIPERK